MSEENKQVEVKPVEPIAKVVEEVEPKPNDDETVAIATFRSMEKTMVKRRDEAKALKEELAAYKAKESEAEQKLLEEQGKHKEIAEMYK
ncbi:MAG: hypothetical protein JRE23_17395, partial [Deltaproteobacteria bacterium]|nr:hypothetical protein [Deltaproteobacteria bacterium]